MSIGEFLAQLQSSLDKQPRVIVSGNDSAGIKRKKKRLMKHMRHFEHL